MEGSLIVFSLLGIYDIGLKKHYIFERFMYDSLISKNWEIKEMVLKDSATLSYEVDGKEKGLYIDSIMNQLTQYHLNKEYKEIRAISITSLIERIKQLRTDFLFDLHVYSFFRNRGFEIRNGKGFGVDYLIYEENQKHSNYLTIITENPDFDNKKLLMVSRVAKNMNKSVMIILKHTKSFEPSSDKDYHTELLTYLETDIKYLILA